MGKFWILLLNEFRNYKLCFLDDGVNSLDGNYLEFFHLLGITDDRFVTIDKPSKFKRIIIPDEGKKDNRYSLEYKNVFIAITQKALEETEDISIPKKIYFSRRQFNGSKEIGEESIEDAFKRAGYTILYPEQLSLKKQILCYQMAEEIACINGSIPLNAVFASNELRLVVINKTSLFHGNLVFVTNMMEITPTYIDAYYEPIKGHPRFLGEGPFWIEVNENLIKYLKEAGYSGNIKKSKRTVYLYIVYYSLYIKNQMIKKLRKVYRTYVK